MDQVNEDERHHAGDDGEAILMLLPTVAVGAKKSVIDHVEYDNESVLEELERNATCLEEVTAATTTTSSGQEEVRKCSSQDQDQVTSSSFSKDEVNKCCLPILHVEVNKNKSQEQVCQGSQEQECCQEQVYQSQGVVNKSSSSSSSSSTANSNSEGITSNSNKNKNENENSIDDKHSPHPNGDAHLPTLQSKQAMDPNPNPNCPTEIHAQGCCGDSCISSITPGLGEVYQGVMYPTLQVLLLDQHHHQQEELPRNTFDSIGLQQQHQEKREQENQTCPTNDNDQNHSNDAKTPSTAPTVTLSPSMVERVIALEQDVYVCAKRQPTPVSVISPEAVERLAALERDVCAKKRLATPGKPRVHDDEKSPAALTTLEDNVLNKTTPHTTGSAALCLERDSIGGVSNPTTTGNSQVCPGAYFIPGTNAAASERCLDHARDTHNSDQLQHIDGNHTMDGTSEHRESHDEEDATLTFDSEAHPTTSAFGSSTRSVDSGSLQPSHFSASASADEVSSTAAETVTESHNNNGNEALSGEEQPNSLSTTLAQASPVPPEEFPLQVAESVNDSGKLNRKGRRQYGRDPVGWEDKSFWPSESPKCRNLPLIAYMVTALYVLLVLSAIIAVATVLTQQQENDRLSRRDLDGLQIQKQLESVFGAGFFADLTSPQSRAWEWLVYRDPLQLNVNATNLLQRFLVVFFYFATSQHGLWKECNPPNLDLVTNNDNAAATTDLCYYEGLLGDGTYTVDGYTLNYERFDEILAVRWLTGAHECHWAGLFCNDKDEIDGIHLDDMLLNGTLPSELSHLSSLRSISLSTNQLFGGLPSELGRLTNLSFLALKLNAFTGQIPSAWLDPSMSRFFDSLVHLDLSHNLLSVGDVLPSIPVLSNLEHLALDNVGITGMLPTQLFQLTRLTLMYLRSNAITGTLPTEIGLVSEMQLISFRRTDLSGTIPTEVGLMTGLREIDMWGTRISGTIPEEIYTMDTRSFNALILGECNLSGTISTNIGLATTLGFVLLSKNPLLTGKIPTEIGLLTDLSRLDVDGTGLTGSIPTELCESRGDLLLARVKADCEALSNGATPMVCPVGCCTHCCNRETQTCTKTIYNDGGVY